MNLFTHFLGKIGKALGDIFSAPRADQIVHASRIIERQKEGREKLNKSLVQLVFHRKKIELEIKKIEEKERSLSEDLEVTALQDKDELALHVMEELELLEKQKKDLKDNLNLILSEISSLKKIEVDFDKNIKKSESQMSLLKSKTESMRLQSSLKQYLNQINEDKVYYNSDVSLVEENLLRVEAELESLNKNQEAWKDELKLLRRDRQLTNRDFKLQELKKYLKSRSLPERAFVREVDIISR